MYKVFFLLLLPHSLRAFSERMIFKDLKKIIKSCWKSNKLGGLLKNLHLRMK